jgi:superfamily I DNA/RNA helicase/mRNA-degrading endonuclease RelE of RelBE toxin-antitoxin system
LTTFNIAQAEKFPLELGRMPKKVQNAYIQVVLPALRNSPDEADPPRIKRLAGYKGLWRMRVSDSYRLVYRVDRTGSHVTMLMIDHRAKIYDRLGANDDGTPSVQIVVNAEELLERKPTREEIGNAIIDQANDQIERDDPTSEQQLPEELSAEILTSWGVSSNYHEILKSVRTEGELLSLVEKVPSKTLELVMNGIWPPKIEEVVQQPVLIVQDLSPVESSGDSAQSLESFLLKLDDNQKSFVARFEVGRPKGPWLLKGGPGSGKSTVAMYCIKALVRGSIAELALDDKPLRILFTTFTNSLTNASIHLLKALSIEGGQNKIVVRTVDKLVPGHLPNQLKNLKVASGRKPREFVQRALAQCKDADPKFGFSSSDDEFLDEEIEWVIEGQGLTKVEEYVEADRSGRGRALGQIQRRQVWTLFEKFQNLMGDEEVCSFSQRLREAAKHVVPEYDYVFIDEAQDLKPVAIRFCIGLSHNPNNVFLTADTNQSIYGNGMSWTRVASDLRFQGRARNLRRNYRTTAEIWGAVSRLAPDGDGVDRETLDVETVFRGPFPMLAYYSNFQEMGTRLNSYLFEALRQERVTPSSAAVLCPTNKVLSEVVDLLDPRLKARAMRSRDVDIGHQGIKVMTMHAAKGLQFPVVAVVGIEDGKMPWRMPQGINEDEHLSRLQRVFFVACSRAMRRLIVFANREHLSPFISEASDDHWEIEGR